MVSVEHQIKLLHQCLVEKFNEIKQENENIETRLHKIEELLYKEKEIEVERKLKPQTKGNSTSHRPNNTKERKQSASKQKPNQKQKKHKVAKLTSSKSTLITDQNEEDKIQDDEDDLDDAYDYGDPEEFNMDRLNDATSEESHLSQTLDDDGSRHDTEKKELPTRCFEGHSFRPLTGWVNKEGNYEISKEAIEFSPSLVR